MVYVIFYFGLLDTFIKTVKIFEKNCKQHQKCKSLVWVRLGVQEEEQNKGMQDWRKLVPTYSSLATSSILFWELGYSHTKAPFVVLQKIDHPSDMYKNLRMRDPRYKDEYLD